MTLWGNTQERLVLLESPRRIHRRSHDVPPEVQGGTQQDDRMEETRWTRSPSRSLLRSHVSQWSFQLPIHSYRFSWRQLRCSFICPCQCFSHCQKVVICRIRTPDSKGHPTSPWYVDSFDLLVNYQVKPAKVYAKSYASVLPIPRLIPERLNRVGNTQDCQIAGKSR